MSKFIILTVLAGAMIAFAEPELPLIQSATPLGLDSLVALGTRHNPDVRKAGYDTRLISIGKLAAIGNFLPQVSLGASFSENHFESSTFTNPDGSVSTLPITTTETYFVEDPETGFVRLEQREVMIPISEGKTRSSSYDITATVPLFEGGRRYFLWRLANSTAKIYDLSLLDAQKNLARSIAQQVVTVLTTEKLVDLNKKLRDQRQDAFDLAKARFEVGSVTELDVLQAEIELGQSENAIRSSERDLLSQREQLYRLLGISLDSDFPLDEAADVTPYQFELDVLVDQAFQNRTDLEIATQQSKSAKHNLSIARTGYLPNLSLGASRGRSEQSGAAESFTLDPRNKSTTYWLSANWNLFDGFSRELDVATRRVARDRALEDERDLRQGIEQSVRDAFYTLNTIYEQMQTTERNRDLADRTLNLERERYRLGATSALALRDAQVTYSQAETDHLSKQLEYQSSLIALELAVGKTLR